MLKTISTGNVLYDLGYRSYRAQRCNNDNWCYRVFKKGSLAARIISHQALKDLKILEAMAKKNNIFRQSFQLIEEGWQTNGYTTVPIRTYNLAAPYMFKESTKTVYCIKHSQWGYQQINVQIWKLMKLHEKYI